MLSRKKILSLLVLLYLKNLCKYRVYNYSFV
nr:MAG TPA: hypothetical protein [Bacteriophage sp.]